MNKKWYIRIYTLKVFANILEYKSFGTHVYGSNNVWTKTEKQFKWALKEYLHSNSFYSLNEFYNYNRL